MFVAIVAVSATSYELFEKRFLLLISAGLQIHPAWISNPARSAETSTELPVNLQRIQKVRVVHIRRHRMI